MSFTENFDDPTQPGAGPHNDEVDTVACCRPCFHCLLNCFVSVSGWVIMCVLPRKLIQTVVDVTVPAVVHGVELVESINFASSRCCAPRVDELVGNFFSLG